MSELIGIYNRMRDHERSAFRAYQAGLADRDKDNRRRALKDYRTFLDYMEKIGRINREQRDFLEYYRMEERHV